MTLKSLLSPLVLVASLLSLPAPGSSAAEWQWSVPMGQGRAYLWIPSSCDRVRAVVVGQDNMLEPGILEHPVFRRTLADLGIAEILISPIFDPVYRFDADAGARFDAMLQALSERCGYEELASAPVVPIGHSACASFPWNFAAANPSRTLAVLSIKGDAPCTPLTGSGKPNPDWGTRSIDGIPGLMVMSEYEWWDARLLPLLAFRRAHPEAPLALLADVNHSHFDAQDSLVGFLALFLRKAASARLPRLRPVAPSDGCLVDRWRGDAPLRADAAPAAQYRGDPAEALWCFDEEMARATEACYVASRGKRKQQVDFVQAGEFAPLSSSHAGVELPFRPLNDGLTFRLEAGFIDPVPPRPPLAAKDKPPPVTVVRPGRAADHAHAAGAVRVIPITGPVVKLDDTTFRVAFNRFTPGADRRGRDIWLAAVHPGDDLYKGAVQQAVLHVPEHPTGVRPRLTVAPIPNQHAGLAQVKLNAQSDHPELPIQFYVREGPAEIDGDVLRLTAIPPRAAFPIAVTVVAWQLGRSAEPPLRDAAPVESTFLIER